jgi:RNA polymerase sigma factor (sigma-70 family)
LNLLGPTGIVLGDVSNSPGGPTDLAQLLEMELRSSYRLAAVILANPVEAEDATHDAVLKACRAWGSLRDPAKAAAWFQRILVNECRQRIRLRRRGPVAFTFAPTSTPDRSIELEQRDEMASALSHLEPDQREVVILAYYADMTIAQIAEVLGIRTGTVKSRLHYGLQYLRAEYERGRRVGLEATENG